MKFLFVCCELTKRGKKVSEDACKGYFEKKASELRSLRARACVRARDEATVAIKKSHRMEANLIETFKSCDIFVERCLFLAINLPFSKNKFTFLSNTDYISLIQHKSGKQDHIGITKLFNSKG
jgi:hypothetical protein